jgi:hypothetical protein
MPLRTIGEALNLKPETLNSKPQTLNPKPCVCEAGLGPPS